MGSRENFLDMTRNRPQPHFSMVLLCSRASYPAAKKSFTTINLFVSVKIIWISTLLEMNAKLTPIEL